MLHSKPPTDPLAKPPTVQAKKSNLRVSSRRPIATNSRIKQDENYKKDMYLAFVHNALQQKANASLDLFRTRSVTHKLTFCMQGISGPFNELVDQFNPKNQTGQSVLYLARLRLWISALSHVVSRLDRAHSTLVHAILNMPWITLDSPTVKAYTVFIGMLISARPEYLSLVLGKIAQGFTHRAFHPFFFSSVFQTIYATESTLQTLREGIPIESSSTITRRVLYDRLHDLLRHLLSLVPTLSSTLQPLLVKNFPHKRQNQITQTTYIRNLLRVSIYCPELADKILATIVDRVIQIDVGPLFRKNQDFAHFLDRSRFK